MTHCTESTRISHLLLFYVDDTNLAMEELEAGCRLVDMVVEEEVEGDSAMPRDRKTAKLSYI